MLLREHKGQGSEKMKNQDFKALTNNVDIHYSFSYRYEPRRVQHGS